MCVCDSRPYDLQVQASRLRTVQLELDADNLKELNFTEGDMERVVAQLDKKGEVSYLSK